MRVIGHGVPVENRACSSYAPLVLAASVHGTAALTESAVHWAALGIVFIFVCNLATSFLLALTVALRAREVPARDRLALLSAILRRFLRSPGEFLLPPKDDPQTEHGHQVALSK